MGKGFLALFKKDCRMLVSGKFFLMAVAFLALYTAYVRSEERRVGKECGS